MESIKTKPFTGAKRAIAASFIASLAAYAAYGVDMATLERTSGALFIRGTQMQNASPAPDYAIVASPETLALPEWHEAANALQLKHATEANTQIFAACPTNALDALRAFKPRFVAFLLRPDEFDNAYIVALKKMMRAIDDDPYDDAIWGIVTGPDAQTAQRIAKSSAPSIIESVLATTGVGEDVADGRVAVISDAYPKGEWWRKGLCGKVAHHSETGSVVHAFVNLWSDVEPELLLTSSHATEHNLEMPFSLGNIVVTNGTFAAAPQVGWQGEVQPLAAPKKEKVWLAAGNCLIANHVSCSDMIMTALSFGKVNQFVGYIKPTWFGFAGWTTWRYFGALGYPLSISHYGAEQLLLRRLETGAYKDELELKGLLWDREGTVFYGDPMHRVCTRSSVSGARYESSDPIILIFPRSSSTRRLDNTPEGVKIFEADDFAIIEIEAQ